MKIAIAAGGTGGHIYPALTLAEALKERGHEIVFFGSSDRMEKDIIPASEFEFVALDVLSTQGGIINKIRSVFSIFRSYFECRKLLKGYDMVIGFGNYISIPVVMAGRANGSKTVIHEQNSFAGKANKFLDRRVDLVIGSYEEDREQFRNPHTLILGNPQS
ncbi:MAG: glycosyltransferase [Erysipelotrichaceae bacterium]|nr:glycosyltransferase [Erysipelotrichaceae bacterium]